jgi:hypothetical protein
MNCPVGSRTPIANATTNACGPHGLTSSVRFAWLLLGILAAFLFLTVPSPARVHAAAEARPGATLQSTSARPAIAASTQSAPASAPCAYFLDHQGCPHPPAGLTYANPDLPCATSPAPASIAFPATTCSAVRSAPPRTLSIPLYLQTARLRI